MDDGRPVALAVRERLTEGLDEIVAERAHSRLLLVSVLMLAARVATVRCSSDPFYNVRIESGGARLVQDLALVNHGALASASGSGSAAASGAGEPGRESMGRVWHSRW